MTDANSVQALDTLRARLNRLHDTQGLSWRKIAAMRQFSAIPHSTLRAIAVEGREPKNELQRHILGLPPRTVEVAPCVQCGELHEQKTTCPHELQRARRNRPKVYTLAFRFRSREDFERARAAVDADGDRAGWLLGKVDKEDEEVEDAEGN